MIRRHSSQFRTIKSVQGASFADGLNLADALPVLPGPPAWTTGQQLIDNVQLQPQATETWHVLGYSVFLRLAYEFPQFDFFGKFGHIKTGLAVPLPATAPNPAIFGNNPYQTLPPDSTLISTIWEPDTDPLPPRWTLADTLAIKRPGTFLDLTSTNMLPVPIELSNLTQPINSLTIGIWQLPSLLAFVNTPSLNAALGIWDAAYTIYYDDGVPLTSGIPG